VSNTHAYQDLKVARYIKGRIPRHIGVIPDGNRRYAKKYGLTYLEAYQHGVEKAQDFAEWCRELGIKYLTYYSLSLENLKNRSSSELDILFKLMEQYLKKMLYDERIHRERVRIRVAGRIEKLPSNIQQLIKELEKATASYDRYHIILLIAYSGRLEIIDAVRKILTNMSGSCNVNEEVFRRYLYIPEIPDPDLILRTSGEMRISNFLLWQSAYSELIFIKKYWPEITKEDLIRAIEEYQHRERRFGR